MGTNVESPMDDMAKQNQTIFSETTENEEIVDNEEILENLKLQYQIELIPHYHLKVLSYLVLL